VTSRRVPDWPMSCCQGGRLPTQERMATNHPLMALTLGCDNSATTSRLDLAFHQVVALLCPVLKAGHVRHAYHQVR
jgi:hypothetical protein